ncbi:hypothetical protein KIW84_065441 [Lathyrus oleraceus]|uniref:Uncharacterized protein n=1 Tax=Pisum sativum TaxID=3888 RepID=A0A9D5A7F3_PEA|nr:hypothetical protein KIW84_065441 [Pisum sativum]
MQLRREKGLCYYCDEKFSFRHRCPNKHLYLLQLDDPNPDEPDPLTDPDSNLSTNPPNIEPELHLSLNALNGSTKLPIEPAPDFNVLVGNCQSIMAEGQIPQLTIEVQGQVMVIPVFLLPFSGADLILGVTNPLPVPAQLHHIRRLHHTNSISEIFTMHMFYLETSSEPVLELPPDFPPDLVQLLHHYHMIFQNPTTLPPPRSQDHSIPLVDESIMVKVRPYRYPHSQKEQIEKMVEEMLNQGIIQPSTSPFSSPIILVKKKDGTWRFCSDYSALNLALYGRDPPALIRSRGSSEDPPDLQAQLTQREELLVQLQANLHKAQQTMKLQVVFDGGGIARLPICEEGPQHAELENVAAQEGIKVGSDPEIVEARRG